MKSLRALWLLPALVGCGEELRPPPSPPPPPPSQESTPSIAPPTGSVALPVTPPPSPDPINLDFKAVALPGATAPASLDYIAYEPGRSRVWVPVGGTGSVDVYDISSGSFTRVDGFKTAQREYKGKTRRVGPSAVAIGGGTAFIGNRASSEVCAVDTGTLKLGTCIKLGSPTDGVAYVSPTKEVWVTTPRDQSIVVLDATKPDALKVKETLRLEGAPEGYAIDPRQGLFFTNLEDKNKTVVIDIQSRATKATWSLDCDADGPRGVAAETRGLVYVACSDHVVVLDGLHEGTKVGELDTGAGVDNIDWFEPQHLLYAAAAKASRVTVARVDDHGQAVRIAVGTSVAGARNGVVDANGNVYVIDPVNARLLVFALR